MCIAYRIAEEFLSCYGLTVPVSSIAEDNVEEGKHLFHCIQKRYNQNTCKRFQNGHLILRLQYHLWFFGERVVSICISTLLIHSFIYLIPCFLGTQCGYNVNVNGKTPGPESFLDWILDWALYGHCLLAVIMKVKIRI